jgi:hypothetical protein
MNYNVFDPFLARDTWYTSHLLDEIAFYQCLQKVAERPAFSPESMGEYIASAKKGTLEEDYLAQCVQGLVSKAWTVRDYLAVVRREAE